MERTSIIPSYGSLVGREKASDRAVDDGSVDGDSLR